MLVCVNLHMCPSYICMFVYVYPCSNVCRLLEHVTDLLDCLDKNRNVVLSGTISELEENLSVGCVLCVYLLVFM